MFVEGDFRAAGNDFQALRNELLRLAFVRAAVPGVVAVLVCPICDEPDLVRVIGWADDVHSYKSRLVIDIPWAIAEGIFYFLRHPIGDSEAADGYKGGAGVGVVFRAVHNRSDAMFFRVGLQSQIQGLHRRPSAVGSSQL